MHPILIAGAAVLGLPILLHLLLRQQPKKLVFPAMRFLKQRQKTSQRRVQLKHILLLILRCLLLALFALALFQPTISTGGARNPFGDEPVAAVLVIDTSPSMGYKTGPTTRLDEARRRAKELLAQLPPNSKVAVLPTHDPSGGWLPTTLEAEQRIDSLVEPSGSARPLGPALRAAYDLIATADEDKPDGAEPLVKLVAVFGDGTTGSWDAKDVSGLIAKRDALAQPAAHVFFNVGAKAPTNQSITDVRMDTDRLSGAADAIVTAFVRSEGEDAAGLVVSAQLDDGPADVQPLDLKTGQTLPVTFAFRKPAPGFHTVRVKIDRQNKDALPFDDERTFTFEVQPRRNILCIADRSNVPDRENIVSYWQIAHNDGPQEFSCTVVTPDAVPPLAPFEMVAVIAVADPTPFAGKLREYVQKGGKVLLAPEGPGSDTDKNRPAAYAALDLLPAPLGEVKAFEPIDGWKYGRAWKIDEEADLRHPFFAPIRDWQKQGNVDIFRNRRVTQKYRELKAGDINVIARYIGGEPALVERTVEKGTVLLLTTRLDNLAGEKDDFWNDFWVRENSSWPVVFPWLVTKYLCEQGTDAAGTTTTRRYNFTTGAEVLVGVRGFAPPNGERRLRLEGPGVAAAKSKFTLPVDATTLTMRNKPTDGGRTVGTDVWDMEGEPLHTPGSFALYPDGVESPWRFRLSLAVPPVESDLQPTPPESVAELFGPDADIPVDRQAKLDELIKLRSKNTFDLFPALVLLVLIFFAVEGVMANRFYKLK